MELHTEPLHYRAEDGSWREIQNRLVPSSRSGYEWRNRAGALTVEFASTARPAGMVEASAGETAVGFGLVGASPTSLGVVEGNRITYPEALPGVDLAYEVQGVSLKELLILKRPPTGPLAFPFAVTLDNLTERQEGDGTISLLRADGSAAFVVPRGWMEDSSWDPASDEPAWSENVTFSLGTRRGAMVLTVTPDLAWLQDPARVYPVIIDPTLNKDVQYDTFVQSNIQNTPQNTSDELKAGTYDGGATKARTLLKFTGLQTALGGKHILSADLKMYEFHSWSCSARQVHIRRLTEDWSAGTALWSNQPTAGSTALDEINVAKGYSGSCPDGWVTFDATIPVRNWVDDTWPNYGFRVQASNENDSYGWKKFFSKEKGATWEPYLKVTYNSYPATPSNLTPSTGAFSPDDTPQLSATYSDPDSGDNGYVKFEIYRSSDNYRVAYGNGTTVAPGQTSTWVVPDQVPVLLEEGVSYYWQAQAFDLTDTSLWTTSHPTYTVDKTNPTGTLTAPQNEALVSGAITLTASPSDPGTGSSGVKKVDFYATSLGQKILLATDTDGSNGWSVSVATKTIPEGRTDLIAEFMDNAGNLNCCAPGAGVAVTVNNANPAPEVWESAYRDHEIGVAEDSDLQVALGTGTLALHLGGPQLPGTGFRPSVEQRFQSRSGARGILGHGWRTNLEDALVRGVDGSILHVDRAGHERHFSVQTAPSLTAQYWNNTTLAGSPALTREDAQISFDWGNGSPGGGVNSDNFSARWTGFVSIPAPGNWTFYASTDEGARVWVDGQYVINNWKTQSQTEVSGTVYLGSGRHELRMEYFEGAGPAAAVLSYEGPGVSKQVVLPAVLSHSSGTFVRPPGVYDTLTQASDGSYTLKDRRQVEAHYAPSGVLDFLTDSDGNLLKIAYDSSGRPQYVCLSATCNASASQISLFYGVDGRLSSVSDVATRSWTYGYDASGRLSSVTDPEGGVTAFSYDSSDRLVQATDAENGSTQVSYDGSGRVASVRDPEATAQSGPATTFSYDTPSPGKITVRRPQANSVTPPGPGLVHEVGASGQLIGITDELGATTTHTYDPDFNLLSETDALGKTTTWTYDDRGNETSETDAAGNSTTSTYSAANKVTSETDPLGHTASFAYDAAGNMTSEIDHLGHTTSFAYDAAGNMTSETDPLGHTASFAYDAAGNVTSETDPMGHTASFAYDAAGNVTSETDPLLNTTSYTYDKLGHVLSMTDPENGKATFAYDKLGRQIKRVDPVGNKTGNDPSQYTWSTTLDRMGRVKTESNPLGNVATTSYDWNGNAVSRTDPRGNTTTLTYDAADQLLSERTLDGATTTYEYDALGRATGITDPKGRTVYTYDAEGNVLSQTDPLGNKTTFTYDAAGNLLTQTTPAGNVTGAAPGSYRTAYAYDADGRLTTVTDPLGHATVYAYDAAGNRVSVTDPVGARTTFSYDADGREIREEHPGSETRVATGTADAASSPEARVELTASGPGTIHAALSWSTSADLDLYLLDGTGAVVAQAPDHAARPEALVYQAAPGNYTLQVLARSGSASWRLDYGLPAVLVETAGYDAADRVSSTTDGSGATGYAYDRASRLTTITFPDNTTQNFGYDAGGRTTSVADPTGTQSRSYDRAARLSTAVDQAAVTSTYAYDAASNEATVTRGAASFTFDHDQQSRFFKRVEGPAVTTVAFGDQVFPTTLTHATGEQDQRTFDPQGAMTSLILRPQAGASTTLSLEYMYDPQLNLTQIRDVTDPLAPVTAASFTYDMADRVTSETFLVGAQTRTLDYAYDPQGNLTVVTAPEGTTTHAYNSGGQLVARTSLSGAMTTYFYDASGKLLRSVAAAGITAYTWGPDGRLTSVTKPDGVQVSFSYDAFGQRTVKRVGTLTTNYSYERGRIASITTGSATTTFTYDQSGTPLTITTGGSTYALRTDFRGSVIELTDVSTHQPAVKYRYDAWGNVLEATGPDSVRSANPFTFLGGQGMIWDSESGLYLMGARYYDVALARFISPDPADDDPSMSPYAYAQDNPLAKIDPTGLRTFTVAGAILDPVRRRKEAFQPDPDQCCGSHDFHQNVKRWIRRHGGHGEKITNWPWSRHPSPFRVGRAADRFTAHFKPVCRRLHRRDRTCNAVGHSFGGIIVSAGAERGVRLDLLMTLGGQGMGPARCPEGGRDIPRRVFWINLYRHSPDEPFASARCADINTLMGIPSHSGYWKNRRVARIAGSAICAMRRRYEYVHREDTSCP